MFRGHHSFSMPKPYASLNMPKKFPEDIQCIIQSKSRSSGSLYISNIEAAENLNTLKKFEIGAVLTCAKGYELNHPPSAIPHYKYIPTVDHDSCDISIHFDDAADFIKDKIAKTNILVHCIAGVSRSVSMVLAYLIREHNLSYEEAYRRVKAKRNIVKHSLKQICPNDGFIKQLRQYQTKINARRNKQAENQPKNSPRVLTSQHKPVDNKTPTKRDSYMNTGLRQGYPSIQLTPTLNHNKQRMEKYQSTEISSKRYNYIQSASLSPLQKKQNRYLFNRTATGYFTSNNKVPKNYEQQFETSNNDVLSRYDTFTPVSEKIIPMDFTPEKQQLKSLTPKKMSHKETLKAEKGGTDYSRKGYFQQMNKELSEKIDQIRKKYDSQRNKLFEKYQLTDKRIPARANGDFRLRAQEYESVYANNRKNGSLPSDKILRRQSDERVLNGEQGMNRNYAEAKQMFSRSRKSYAQIYENYMKGESRQPLRQEDRYYKGYSYQVQKNMDINLNRYRPAARYQQYRTRGYSNYITDPYNYLYRRF